MSDGYDENRTPSSGAGLWFGLALGAIFLACLGFGGLGGVLWFSTRAAIQSERAAQEEQRLRAEREAEQEGRQEAARQAARPTGSTERRSAPGLRSAP
jgi:hypothetical protein